MCTGYYNVHSSSTQFRLTINDQDALSLLYQELYRLGVFVSEDFKINDLDDPPAPSKPLAGAHCGMH